MPTHPRAATEPARRPRWQAWAELDRRVWRMAFARCVNTMGLSLVMTFFGVYIVETRGYPAGPGYPSSGQPPVPGGTRPMSPSPGYQQGRIPTGGPSGGRAPVGAASIPQPGPAMADSDHGYDSGSRPRPGSGGNRRTVTIAAVGGEAGEMARRMIAGMTEEAEVGRIFREESGRSLAALIRAFLRPGQRLVSPAGDLWRWDGYSTAAEAPSAAARRLAVRTGDRDAQCLTSATGIEWTTTTAASGSVPARLPRRCRTDGPRARHRRQPGGRHRARRVVLAARHRDARGDGRRGVDHT